MLNNHDLGTQTVSEEHCVEGFSIQKYGFKFPNQFADSPFKIGPFEVGNANKGLCGGMAAAAAGYFRHHLEVPPDTIAPSSKHKPELLEYLKKCQWATTNPSALWKYGRWTFDDATADKKHIHEAWFKIKHAIDKNEPAVIGLIRSKATIFNLGKNIFNRAELEKPFTQHHQILAFAYKRYTDQIILSAYDPAYPGADNVKLLFHPDGSIIQHVKQIAENNFQDLGKVYSFFIVEYNFDEKPPVYAADVKYEDSFKLCFTNRNLG